MLIGAASILKCQRNLIYQEVEQVKSVIKVANAPSHKERKDHLRRLGAILSSARDRRAAQGVDAAEDWQESLKHFLS